MGGKMVDEGIIKNDKKLVRVGDFVASYLVSLGISHVFLVSGGGMMYLLDGLRCNKDITFVCAHNEAAAAIMAEGYSRVSENIGVVFVTTGPGATNAVTGAVDAWVDSIPMLVISGQCKRSQNVQNSGIEGLRSLGGQEVDILPIVKSFTKYSAMVNDPKLIKYHLQKAVYHAKSGRPGPTWLDIPLDVQSSLIDINNLESFTPSEEKLDEVLLDRQVSETLKLLHEASRPVIIVGNGVRQAGACKEFLTLVDKAHVPIVASKLGQDLIDDSHPYYAGFAGSKGTRAGNMAMQNADLILSIGCRLAIPFVGYEYELFARGAKKIAVDIDPRELIKPTIKIDVPINCDAKIFINKLLDRLSSAQLKEYKEWVDKCRYWKNKYNTSPEGLSKKNTPACSYNLFDRLSRLLDSNAIIIADAGSVYCIISQAFKVKYGQRVITPACLGSMGLSLPLGIGACYAANGATVVAVTGDGSLQMNIQELQTMFHNQVPLKLVVVNNNGYVSIRNSQDSYFQSRYAGSDPNSGVSCPDLKKIAYAYGIPYESIRDENELERMLENIIDHPGPIICEVYTDTQQKIIPSISSKELPDGRLVSAPLEDMWPFLPREELEKEMIIKPVEYNK
jgi:acetolactate synthase I/II/III large subunit